MVKKKDKIAILYAIILCILFIIHINSRLLDGYDDYIFIILMFMIWDLFFRPRKYEITFTYLSNAYLYDKVELYCIYDSNHMVQDVYCRVESDNILDGYRKLNPILGFSTVTTLELFKDVAKNITNVEQLTDFMTKNYNVSYKAKQYEYYKSNVNLLTWGGLAIIVVISVVYYFLNMHQSSEIVSSYYVF